MFTFRAESDLGEIHIPKTKMTGTIFRFYIMQNKRIGRGPHKVRTSVNLVKLDVSFTPLKFLQLNSCLRLSLNKSVRKVE